MTPRRRRIFVAGARELGPLATPVAEWTERLGHLLVSETDRLEADLEVRCAGAPLALLGAEPSPSPGFPASSEPPSVEPASSEARAGAAPRGGRGRKWIAISPFRTSVERQRTLLAAGASAVLDGHHGLFDLAFAYAELLFAQRAEQRRHGWAHGRLDIDVYGSEDGSGGLGSGRLVGLNRCGAWVHLPSASPACGAVVRLDLPLGDRTVRLPGRVVCDRAPGAELPLIGVELAYEQGEGLSSFRSWARARRPRASRVGSSA